MDVDDLFAEKSLFGIFSAAQKKLPRTRFNRAVLILGALFIAVAGVSLWTSPEKLADGARILADVAIGFGSQILGFLVGGFAIFASISKPEFFLFLHQRRHKSGLTYLKYNLFSFVEVFVPYLLLLTVGVLIKIFAYPGGPAARLLDVCATISPSMNGICYSAFTFVAFLVCGQCLLWSLIALKSFIFNLYHVVMTIISWEQHKGEGPSTHS